MACVIQNGRRYYYSTRREGGKVIRQYLGTGEAGSLAQAMSVYQRAFKEEQRAAEQAAKVSADRVERRAKNWYGQTETLFREAMAEAGYYRHSGGEWRKRRAIGKKGSEELCGMTQEDENQELARSQRDQTDHALLTSLRAWPHMEEGERQRHLTTMTHEQRELVVTMAQRGRKDLVPVALDVVRPQSAAIYRESFGSMAAATNLLVPNKESSPVSRQVAVLEADRLFRQIAGEAPTPLETLLASRIVSCSLVVDHYQKRLEVATTSGNMQSGLNWERRLDSANRRYLAAIKSLALVRRLQLPMLQVNIGQKQINLAQQGTNQVNIAPDPSDSMGA